MDAEEVIARPLEAIHRIEKEECYDCPAGEDHVKRAFEELLCSGPNPALGRVPLLSKKSLLGGQLLSNTLVRYRGMVQDMYDPEYFVASYDEVETATGVRTKISSMYTEILTNRPGFISDLEGASSQTTERLPLFCVPVPGESPWVGPPGGKEAEVQVANSDLVLRERNKSVISKRPREGDGQAMDCTDDDGLDLSALPVAGRGLATCHRQKALRPDRQPPCGGEEGGSARLSAQEAPGGEGAEVMTSLTVFQQELDLEDVPCLVKMYGLREGEVKLNDTMDFVGVLVYDQAFPNPSQAVAVGPGGGCGDGEGEGEGEGGGCLGGQGGGWINGNPFEGLEGFSRKIPPASLAPRLHCVWHRKLLACAPLQVDPIGPLHALHTIQGPLPFGAFMREAKRLAIGHLSAALSGDNLAAEYALLALISRAHTRTETTAPGFLSVNLRGMSPGAVKAFRVAVSDLVPKSVLVPVTTDALSQEYKFAPKKDYNVDRLMLSKLQLSSGTVVLLDETSLEPGQINAEGVQNLSVLRSLLSLQKVPYDFGFYQMDFEVDHPCLYLSRGKPMVATAASVPVLPLPSPQSCPGVASLAPVPAPAPAPWLAGAQTIVQPEDPAQLATCTGNKSSVATGASGSRREGEVLGRLRVYLGAVRLLSLSQEGSCSGLAEEDFVKARREGNCVTEEDFHRWLTIARLTALSLGDIAVEERHWIHMKGMEAQVKDRLRDSTSCPSDVGDVSGGVGRYGTPQSLLQERSPDSVMAADDLTGLPKQ